MENSGLIELLKTLTNKELKDFVLFLDSPYFGKGRYKKEGKSLFLLLQKYAPEYDHPKLSKSTAYAHVFPGEPFAEGRLEKVMTELLRVLRTFLLVEHQFSPERENANQVEFAKILSDRGLKQKALAASKSVEDDLLTLAIKKNEDFGLLFEASKNQYSIVTEKNRWKDDLGISDCLRYLDLYYYSNRLALLNHFLLISHLARVESSIDLAHERQIYAMFSVQPEEAPSLYIAQRIFELYTEEQPNAASFDHIMESIQQYETCMDVEHIKSYYSFMRSYCTQLISKGLIEFWGMLHKINQDNLQKGYFFYNSLISPGAFSNIVSAALVVKELDWAHQFLNTYKDRIVADTDKEIYHLNLAAYYFAVGQYQQCLDTLPQSLQNLDAGLTARRTEIKAYFELKSDLVFYKLDAFKMYISRASKKILSDDARERHANFVNLLLQILQSKPGDQDRSATILKRIEEKELVTERVWLIEKAKDL